MEKWPATVALKQLRVSGSPSEDSISIEFVAPLPSKVDESDRFEGSCSKAIESSVGTAEVRVSADAGSN